MVKAYFDTCIQSGRLRADLKPAEMSAVRALEKADRKGTIEIVTSRETHREQERTNDPMLRAQLVQSHGNTPVVPKDHTLLGIHNQMDRFGTVSTTPIITEIVDDAVFKNLTAAGLKNADARHLMYAAHNECDRFVTTDPGFTDRRPQLEKLCPGLKIVTPSELAAEVSIEKSIKRPLSDAEAAAISRLRGRLPKDRRKRKRILRQAREKARRNELVPVHDPR
jgi:predicted nucleic acid-binding protein